MLMRVRLPELLKERDWTPYRLAQEAGERASLSAIYRLVRAKGHARYLDSDMLDALCEAFGIGPGELLERDTSTTKRKR